MEKSPKALNLKHGKLTLPAFIPDATFGTVRSLDSSDLEKCGITALMMNTFHLIQHPGASVIKSLGGLNNMCHWQHPIVTDSGGFQTYSMIRQNSKYGSITDRGIVFYPEGSKEKIIFTPEKVIQRQINFGSDIIFCLDECTDISDDYSKQERAVERTISWAKRCKEEFVSQLKKRTIYEERRPLLFAVIQGGGSLELRKRCAEELLCLDFDGFGFGGWPLDENNNLLTDILQFVRELIPGHIPMHALGIGHPLSLIRSAAIGYNIFDCTMPTRDARHGRLYKMEADEINKNLLLKNREYFSYTYVKDEKYKRIKDPISSYCDQICCQRYSSAYLNHLFSINDPLYFRLATIHNLRFMVKLVEQLRKSSDSTDNYAASGADNNYSAESLSENPTTVISTASSSIKEIIDNVKSSKRYKNVHCDLVDQIATEEISKRRNLKDAIKATKNKLHQIGGAYFENNPPYKRWKEELRSTVAKKDPESIKELVSPYNEKSLVFA